MIDPVSLLLNLPKIHILVLALAWFVRYIDFLLCSYVRLNCIMRLQFPRVLRLGLAWWGMGGREYLHLESHDVHVYALLVHVRRLGVCLSCTQCGNSCPIWMDYYEAEMHVMSRLASFGTLLWFSCAPAVLDYNMWICDGNTPLGIWVRGQWMWGYSAFFSEIGIRMSCILAQFCVVYILSKRCISWVLLLPSVSYGAVVVSMSTRFEVEYASQTENASSENLQEWKLSSRNADYKIIKPRILMSVITRILINLYYVSSHNIGYRCGIILCFYLLMRRRTLEYRGLWHSIGLKISKPELLMSRILREYSRAGCGPMYKSLCRLKRKSRPKALVPFVEYLFNRWTQNMQRYNKRK